jgi:Na+:H+ antiporter
MEFRDLLLGLVLVWLAAKAASEGMQRIGQTAVLGELLAGVIIGPGVLGLVHESQVLHALAELGVLILLFEVGLESDLDELLRAGVQAMFVAAVGVAVPFALGFMLMYWLGYSVLMSVFVGATLTATSVGITARVLADLGRLKDAAAEVVLGAAVVDDILGLVILAVVTGIAQTGAVSLASVALLSTKAIVSLAVAIVLGVRLAPVLISWIDRMQARGSLIVYSMIFAVALAAVADLIGLTTIIGAFAAGLVLATTERRENLEQRIKPVADLLVPVFFVTVGMKVQPATLAGFRPGYSSSWRRRWSCGQAGPSSSGAGRRSSTAASTCSRSSRPAPGWRTSTASLGCSRPGSSRHRSARTAARSGSTSRPQPSSRSSCCWAKCSSCARAARPAVRSGRCSAWRRRRHAGSGTTAPRRTCRSSMCRSVTGYACDPVRKSPSTAWCSKAEARWTSRW